MRRSALELKEALQKKLDEAKARLEIEEMKRELKKLTAKNVAIRKANGKERAEKQAAKSAKQD